MGSSPPWRTDNDEKSDAGAENIDKEIPTSHSITVSSSDTSITDFVEMEANFDYVISVIRSCTMYRGSCDERIRVLLLDQDLLPQILHQGPGKAGLHLQPGSGKADGVLEPDQCIYGQGDTSIAQVLLQG